MSEKEALAQIQNENLGTPNDNKNTKKIQTSSPVMKQQQNHDDEDSKVSNEKRSDQNDPNSSKRQWSKQQDKLVYQLHNQFGNKWAIISEHLKGRSDNCIKNHFYSRLRKGLRKMNNLIEGQFKKTFKQFRTIDLYKVVQASDQKFKQAKSEPNETTDFGLNLKNRLFIHAEQQQDGTDQYKMKVHKLLEDMTQFTKNYKRKSKKNRRYSPMGVDSVYRVKSKRSLEYVEMAAQQTQNNQKQTYAKIKKQLPAVTVTAKTQQQTDRKQPAGKQKREGPKAIQIDKDMLTMLKESGIIQTLDDNQIKRNRSISKDYRNFSDEEDEQRNEVDYVKQQKLNNFAENILKTFKSYYSFQSFKSNSVMEEEPFFQ